MSSAADNALSLDSSFNILFSSSFSAKVSNIPVFLPKPLTLFPILYIGDDLGEVILLS